MAKKTIYEHFKGDDTFTVTASERWSVGMIHRLEEKYPNEVTILHANDDGSIVASFPFDWMRIVPKRHVEMSEERKREAVERLRAARETKI